VPADFQPQPNADEVDAVFAMPLSAFLDAHQHIHWDVRSKATTQCVAKGWMTIIALQFWQQLNT
jgi:hypothetical protein